MAFDPLTAVLNIGGKVLDKIFPDPAERERAKIEMIRLQQEGQFREVEHQLSAILAEAKSADPWTSRARPSFLYMCYILILSAIPIGVLHAFAPEYAASIAEGFKSWLDAIPNEIITLMGIGYLGYTGARSWDKNKIK